MRFLPLDCRKSFQPSDIFLALFEMLKSAVLKNLACFPNLWAYSPVHFLLISSHDAQNPPPAAVEVHLHILR
jgi:hypothetical protein